MPNTPVCTKQIIITSVCLFMFVCALCACVITSITIHTHHNDNIGHTAIPYATQLTD